jgi:hypothetical protein
MDDIIRYQIIPLAPFEFVCVSWGVRDWAIEVLSSTRFECVSDEYNRVIQILGAAARYTNLIRFTQLNFNKNDFSRKIVDLMITDYPETIIELYRYTKWFDKSTINAMIDVATEQLIFEHLVSVCRYLPDDNVKCEPIRERTRVTFMERYMEFKHSMNKKYIKQHVEFTMRYFPDIIHDYINTFAHGAYRWPLNCDMKCMATALELAERDLDADSIASCWQRLWRNRNDCIVYQLQNELRGTPKIKTPLFNRLRRRSLDNLDELRTVYVNVLLELKIKVRLRGRFSKTPPDISKLRMMTSKK